MMIPGGPVTGPVSPADPSICRTLPEPRLRAAGARAVGLTESMRTRASSRSRTVSLVAVMPISFRAEQDHDGVVIEVEGSGPSLAGCAASTSSSRGKCLVKNYFVFLCWFRGTGIEHTNRWPDPEVLMRRLPVVSAVSALVAILLAVPVGARAAGQAPAGPVQEPLAIGSGGAVASMDVGASQAGIDVLKHGGNAVDAAVATASALGVTIPFVAGPGGGGFMVIYLAKTHQVVTIDGRENCPAACTTTMFLDPKTGQPLDYNHASDQPLATGVPSMVAAWAKAVSQYGRKSLAADLQPAIGVAERGFRVNQDFVQLTQSDLPELQAYPASRSLLLTPSGQPLPVGSLLRNPDLAKTYRLLARYGPSYLYDGPPGQAIVQAVDHPVLTPGQSVVQLPGIMTTADLRAYQARVLAPTRVRYRGLDIYSMAPPSSSGSTVGEALNILSGYNLATEPRVTALFHYLEASRLAYADRNAYVGDPRYVSVPLSGLLDPAFAATRRCLIGNTALASPVAPGNPVPPYGTCPSQGAQQPAPEGGHTNNIVTADKWGDVVAFTNTINFFGGSGETVPGYGFLLNNEMTDFDFAPPSAGATDPNQPAGGKQPRSSMGPA